MPGRQTSARCFFEITFVGFGILRSPKKESAFRSGRNVTYSILVKLRLTLLITFCGLGSLPSAKGFADFVGFLGSLLAIRFSSFHLSVPNDTDKLLPDRV